MSYWIVQQALCQYVYKRDPIEQVDDATERIRFFVRREYKLGLYLESNASVDLETFDPSTAALKVVCTSGVTATPTYPDLSVSNASEGGGDPVNGSTYKEGYDYVTYPNGGVWRVTEAENIYNAATHRWQTYITVEGSWDKYLKVRLTDYEYALFSV
jgi:hypothetical protein